MIGRKTIFIVLVFVGILLASLITLKAPSTQQTNTSPQSTPQSDDSPRIVSTKPDPLEEAIISSTEVIEITFNRPLENEGELKLRFDPKIEFEIKLSQDRKTGKIIPKKPYDLGVTYTLFIGTETKFDGIGRWGEEKIFHFKTIQYRGV